MKTFGKILLALLLCATIPALSVSAMTQAERNAQINDIQNRITALNAQMQTMQANETTNNTNNQDPFASFWGTSNWGTSSSTSTNTNTSSTTSTTNTAYVTITGVSGPTSINTNQPGTWTVNVINPSSGALNYTVSWGDESFIDGFFGKTAQSFSPSPVFTHTYSKAKTYSVKFIVKDSAGRLVNSYITINVGSPNSQNSTNSNTGSNTSIQTSAPPTISSVSGPTSLNMNTAGSWTVDTTNPGNGQLTYAVTWGDEPFLEGFFGTGPTYVNSPVFSHTYAKAGNYFSKFSVKDNFGNAVNKSQTITVINPNAATNTNTNTTNTTNTNTNTNTTNTNTTTNTNANVVAPSCYDSDSGSNYSLKGVVSIGSTNYTDYCVNANQLMEYDCNNYAWSGGTSMVSTKIACYYGCASGICKPEPYQSQSYYQNSNNNNIQDIMGIATQIIGMVGGGGGGGGLGGLGNLGGLGGLLSGGGGLGGLSGLLGGGGGFGF